MADATLTVGDMIRVWRSRSIRAVLLPTFVSAKKKQNRTHDWNATAAGTHPTCITVEQALANYKRWKQLPHWTHRPDGYPVPTKPLSASSPTAPR